MCLVCAAAARRRDRHAHLHPAPRARGDRRARRGQRRDRLRACRAPSRRPSRGSPAARRQRLEVEHPTGFFTVDMEVAVEGRRGRGQALGAAAHGAQADARRGVRAGQRVEARHESAGRRLLGFGEVGQALAVDLGARGVSHLAAWDILFRGPRTARRSRALAAKASAAGASLADAVCDADLVISAVTAGSGCRGRPLGRAASQAQRATSSTSTPCRRRVKVEASQIVEPAGGRYVEAAIMSPINPKRAASPMLFGGPHAAEFLPIARQLGFTGASVFSDRGRPRVGREDVPQRDRSRAWRRCSPSRCSPRAATASRTRCWTRWADLLPDATTGDALARYMISPLARSTVVAAPRRCARSRARSAKPGSSRCMSSAMRRAAGLGRGASRRGRPRRPERHARRDDRLVAAAEASDADHRLPRPLHDRAGRAPAVSRQAARAAARTEHRPRRHRRASATTRSARRIEKNQLQAAARARRGHHAVLAARLGDGASRRRRGDHRRPGRAPATT